MTLVNGAGTAANSEIAAVLFIREQLGRHNADAEYRPTSVITKMDTPELTRDICSKSLHPNTRRLSSERQAVGEPPQANAQFSYNKAYAERHYRAA